jgi:hypothetical protein
MHVKRFQHTHVLKKLCISHWLSQTPGDFHTLENQFRESELGSSLKTNRVRNNPDVPPTSSGQESNQLHHLMSSIQCSHLLVSILKHLQSHCNQAEYNVDMYNHAL